jgi:L-fuconolactonase
MSSPPGQLAGPARLAIDEPALRPDRVIIDAHHHLWGPPRDPYEGNDMLTDATRSHRVLASVYVDARERYDSNAPALLQPLGETRYAAGVAADSSRATDGVVTICAAIIGHADLASGTAVRETLLRHLESGAGHFRGVRHLTALDPTGIRLASYVPPPRLLSDDQFRRGFAQLQRLGLSFDTWVVFHQLDEVVDLAQSFPDVPIVLDHLGTPLGVGAYAGRREEVFGEWRTGIQRVSRCPNVFVKVGGLGMGFVGLPVAQRPGRVASESAASVWRPFVETAIEAFTPDRAMFESNFPVDRSTCSYSVLWNAFQRLADDYSGDEQSALFAGTAARVYDIQIETAAGSAPRRDL